MSLTSEEKQMLLSLIEKDASSVGDFIEEHSVSILADVMQQCGFSYDEGDDDWYNSTHNIILEVKDGAIVFNGATISTQTLIYTIGFINTLKDDHGIT